MSSGIYLIISKRFPDRQYVGSCVNFSLRWSVHRNQLINNCHPNAKLQNHFNKYGADDLYFQKLKFGKKFDLISLEQYFIDELDPYFNICKVAGSRLGTKHSNQTRLRMKKAAKGKNKHSRRSALFGKFQKRGC